MAENCDESEEELGDWYKRKQRQRAEMDLLPHEVRGEIDEHKREE